MTNMHDELCDCLACMVRRTKRRDADRRVNSYLDGFTAMVERRSGKERRVHDLTKENAA